MVGKAHRIGAALEDACATEVGGKVAHLIAQACTCGVVLVGQLSEQALQVKRRFVTTGERRDGQVVVLEGLEDGDQVVSAGQLKLNDGAAVVINNSNPL